MLATKQLYVCAVATAAFLSLPVASIAASTGPLHVQNNEPGAITLSAQTPGACGTWVGTVSPAPPQSVAGSSTSPAFSLSVTGPSCPTINRASLTYTYSNGELVSQCTYTITGDSTFTFAASGVAGCNVIYPPNGGVYFVFPNTASLRVRGAPHHQ